MRPIKFRGIYVDTGEFVYGYLIRYGADNVIFDNLTHTYYRVKHETVGQFTGLYDNTKWEDLTEDEGAEWTQIKGNNEEDWDGREIYDGDVLFHHGSGESNPYGGPHRSFKGEKIYVIAAECGYIARHVSSFGDSYERSPSVIIKGWDIINNYNLWNTSPWSKIIGSIHKNPELLK